jgi:hypothetical protein
MAWTEHIINVKNLARKYVYANEEDRKCNKLPILIFSFRSQHQFNSHKEQKVEHKIYDRGWLF